jgi:hypothetical protein
VQPLVVLVLMPLLLGVACELVFRDTRNASFATALVTPIAVYFCIEALDPSGTWNWLATLLVSPLAIAFALATVLLCFGRSQAPKRHRNGA